MKTAILFAFALLLPACEESETMTFGMDFRVHDGSVPPEQTSAWCMAPGAYDGNTSASSIDRWEMDGLPPHLFLEAEPDAYENVYRVRVYTASERGKDGFWWEPSEVLAERVYDTAFGEGGQRDSFVVDFEGEQYTVEALGLPPDSACP